MAFVFTFLLIASLEIAVGKDDSADIEPPERDPEVCVGCDDEKEEEPEKPQLTVEIRIDPVTGEAQYIIRGLEIE